MEDECEVVVWKASVK